MSPNDAALEPLPAAPAASAVLAMVLTEGPISRVELARRLGLSSAAVTKAARPLLDDGYLHELSAERTAPGAGRPVSPLAITPDREFVAGVKITADEVIGVVCDLRAKVRAAGRRHLNTHEVPGVVAQVAAVVDDLFGGDPVLRDRTRRVGVSLSGDVDRVGGTVRYSPFLGWHDVALAPLVTSGVGLAAVIENDVKALTVAEHWFGDGVGTDNFALVTVGAGIGCGLVVDGKLISGAYGVSGEIGHVCADRAGPLCHCGARGCVEAIASTAAILDRAREVTGREGIEFDEAAALARAGDRALRAVFAAAGAAIGVGIAAVVNLIGPERIVVSGEGLAYCDLFETSIRTTFAERAFGAAATCPVTLGPLPFEEWARGAAAVAIKTLISPAGR